MNAHQSVTIVMIEDDEGHARLIEKNIRRAGISNDIRHFTDGGTAIDYLFNDARGPALNGPALILLDLNLPDMSGTDILVRVKAEDSPLKRTPVVVLTTTDDKVEIQRCYDLGCNVYITKPVNYESFAQAIRQLGLFLSVIQVPDQTEKDAQRLPHTNAHILYIDDDAGLRRLAERGLARRGMRVTLADGGVEGLALASEQRFDLVAVDHYMPGMDGLETLKRISALPDAPPVIYVTGSEEGSIAIAAMKAGAADYVVKTVGEDFFDLLTTSIVNVLAKVALQRAKDQAEADLRASNERLEALLREVNHRVANSLQLVSAFVHLQSGALPEGPARAALQETQTRIAAIGAVHRRLYTSDDVEGVAMDEYLAALVDELGRTWSMTPDHRIRLTSDAIRLPTDRAVSVGVIVNELVSNACKYAYGVNSDGEIRVEFRREGDDCFTLAVEDDGVGMAVDAAPKGTGLGTKLVRTMAQSLQSAVTYDSSRGGLRATLVAPLA